MMAKPTLRAGFRVLEETLKLANGNIGLCATKVAKKREHTDYGGPKLRAGTVFVEPQKAPRSFTR